MYRNIVNRIQPAPPAAAESIVVTAMWPIDPLVALSVLPALNPNEPNHNMKAPTDARGRLEGGTMLLLPSEVNFPIRGPMKIAAANAENPPNAWMTATRQNRPCRSSPKPTSTPKPNVQQADK